VNLVASGEEAEAVATRAGDLAAWCEALVLRSAPAVLVLGPAPCPVTRIKGRTRWHVVLKGPSRDLGRLVRYAATRLGPAGGVRVAIDRDPVSLL
jgi:primosomal protein N' (replication factor Y)